MLLAVAIISKEYYFNIDNIAVSNEKYLVGYAYSENIDRYLKYKTILTHDKYNIMAMGSSRVLQFRSEMFQKRFYNAGYTISLISDFAAFMKVIPKEKYPDYLIIGIDPWMFDENVNDLKTGRTPDYWTLNPTKNIKPKWEHLSNILTDIYKGKITFSNIQTKHDFIPVGLNALINTDGIRNDGSRASGLKIPKLLNGDTSLTDYHFREIKNRINNEVWPLIHGDKINPKAVEILNDFLLFCKQNNIAVISILTPNADEIQNDLSATGKYKYLEKINPTIEPLFAKYKFDYFYFPSVKYCDSDDSETLDGMHGGEKTYLKMLIKMLKSGSVLNNVCNLDQLNEDLAHAKNPYIVYAN